MIKMYMTFLDEDSGFIQKRLTHKRVFIQKRRTHKKKKKSSSKNVLHT